MTEPRRVTPPLVLVAACTSLVSVDCIGNIGDPDSRAGHFTAPVTGVVGAASMRRLTRSEYHHALEQVFGDAVTPPDDLDPDESSELFTTIGASKVATSDHGVEQYHGAAMAVAVEVLDHRQDYPELASCAPASSADPCVASLVASFGRRLWRRSLSDAEVTRHASIVGAAGEEADALGLGMKYVVASLLASPNFVYVGVEGETDPDSGRTRFSSWEMATRLSLLLWDSIPDDELLDAAESGELDSPEGVRAQAERMLDEDRAKAIASRFFGEHWNVSRLEIQNKNPDVFPKWNQALLDSFRQEFTQVLADAVEKEDNLLDVLVRSTTIADAELADFYGSEPSADGSGVIELDGHRAGLFTSGAVISANSPSDRTSPTHRGVFVFERVLCEEIPPPPPNVNTNLEKDSSQTPKSLREQLEQHRKDPACAGCHAVFDPVGLTFENFDGIGEFRTEDAGQTIDSSGGLGGVTFADARDLANYLRHDPRTPHCISERVLTYALGREPEATEAPYVDRIDTAFAASNYSFRELALAVVTSDAFRYFTKESEP